MGYNVTIFNRKEPYMTQFKRILDLNTLLKNKSYFLFGPRGTGKSYLIRNTLDSKIKTINLLKSEEFLDLNTQPQNLRERINPKKDHLVVIDEVQKIPQLLNEVHYLIEEHGIHFLLTGSSVRKLKKSDTNMLGGRARKAELFPICFAEFEKFNLEKYLRYGGLPSILNSIEPKEDLTGYVENYLNDEIKYEAQIRKLNFFHRFLEVSALYSSEVVNFANIASDIGVSEPTVKSYYELLVDSLIGFQLFPWKKGKYRKSISSSKFYYFDTGVLNTLLKSPPILDKNSDLYGKVFEQFIAQELRAYLSYRRKDEPLNFWRSLDKYEVDFVIGDKIAIEVKSSKKVKKDFLKGLEQIQNESNFKRRILVSQDPIQKNINGIECFPWKLFLEELWNDEII